MKMMRNLNEQSVRSDVLQLLLDYNHTFFKAEQINFWGGGKKPESLLGIIGRDRVGSLQH